VQFDIAFLLSAAPLAALPFSSFAVKRLVASPVQKIRRDCNRRPAFSQHWTFGNTLCAAWLLASGTSRDEDWSNTGLRYE
jgi:hypothetical protein